MRLKLFGTGIAALALLVASFSAQATDIPRPYYKGVRAIVAYYNWTGFYVGINGGYAFGDSKWDVPALSLKPTGWLVGGTLGYNYQVGSFVVGLEVDGDWAQVKDSATCAVFFTCQTKTSYLATGRGRIGYAFDRWMPYLTGGAAYGDVQANVSGLATFSATKSKFGWTVGGGLEYAFLDNWSAKVEYLYVDLGSFDTGFTAPFAADNVSFKENIIRAGINYKFSSPILSRYY